MLLSLQRRRKLLPWLFLAPGLAWLLVFFGIPLVNQLYVSLQTGDPETGYVFDWNFARLQRTRSPTTTSSSCARSATRRPRRSCAS